MYLNVRHALLMRNLRYITRRMLFRFLWRAAAHYFSSNNGNSCKGIPCRHVFFTLPTQGGA
jgi:hypothetical protein